MRTVYRIVNFLCELLMFLGGVALILLLVHVIADVTSKYLFRSPIPGTIQVVSWYYMVALSYLPVAYVQLRREHLTVELFTMGLSERGRAFLDGIVGIAGIAYLGLLTRLVFRTAVETTRRGESQDIAFWDIPVWPARWILPAAFGLMAVVLLLQAVLDLTYALTGRKPDLGEPARESDEQAENVGPA